MSSVVCQNVAKQPRKQGINRLPVPNVSTLDENDSDDDDFNDDTEQDGEYEQTRWGTIRPVLLPALL